MDANQDSSRKFIIFIVIIYADGLRIPSILIYKSEFGAI
jgi:hypothetical protein